MTVRIGDRGQTLTGLGPSGKVQIGGETFDARSEFGFIPAGTPCVVVRGDLSAPIVRAIDPDHEPEPLPHQGEEANRKGEAQRMTVDVAEVERQDRLAARKAELHRLGAGVIAAASLGAMVGLAGAGVGPFFAWVPAEDPVKLSLLLAGGLAAGMAWSVAWFFLLGALGRIVGGSQSVFAPSFLSLFALLIGTAIGAWSGYLDGGWEEMIATSLIWAGGCAAVAAVLLVLKDFLPF
jgi:hypothetical protein